MDDWIEDTDPTVPLSPFADPEDEWFSFVNLDALDNHPGRSLADSSSNSLDPLYDPQNGFFSPAQDLGKDDTAPTNSNNTASITLGPSFTPTTVDVSINTEQQISLAGLDVGMHLADPTDEDVPIYSPQLSALPAQYQHGGLSDALQFPEQATSSIIVVPSRDVLGHSEPIYRPLAWTPTKHKRKRSSKLKGSPQEGCGVLELSIGPHNMSGPKRKRTKQQQQNRDNVIGTGGSCLRCRWMKIKCSPGPTCTSCANMIKKTQQTALLWTKCVRADAQSFNVFLFSGHHPPQMCVLTVNLATEKAVPELVRLIRGETAHAQGSSAHSIYAQYNQILDKPQRNGSCPLKWEQTKFLTYLSGTDLPEKVSQLSPVGACVKFIQFNELLSAKRPKVPFGLPQNERAQFLSAKKRLRTIAPYAKLHVEVQRAGASRWMIKLLEDFIRSHPSTSNEFGLRQTAEMIILAVVLYCVLAKFGSFSTRRRLTSKQRFFGEYLLHNIKILTKHAFPSENVLLGAISCVRVGDSIPEGFVRSLADCIQQRPHNLEILVVGNPHLEVEVVGGLHCLNHLLLDLPTNVFANCVTGVSMIPLVRPRAVPKLTLGTVDWLHSAIPTYYTKLFGYTARELSRAMDHLVLQPHDPLETSLYQLTPHFYKSFKVLPLLLRAYLDAAAEIIAHERRILQDHIYASNHLATSQEKSACAPLDWSVETNWNFGKRMMTSMFGFAVIHSFIKTGMVVGGERKQTSEACQISEWQADQEVPICRLKQKKYQSGFHVASLLIRRNRSIWMKWDSFARLIYEDYASSRYQLSTPKEPQGRRRVPPRYGVLKIGNASRNIMRLLMRSSQQESWRV